MKNLRGFTLIELLIVVAIIAILAAIAVPNFLEAQVRAKVSRARSDMRSMATALEAYYVDNNTYPATTVTVAQMIDQSAYGANVPTGNAAPGRTFRRRGNPVTNAAALFTLSTPIAYITSHFQDPFNNVRGATFRYYTEGPGWILGSFGPNTDTAVGGGLRWNFGALYAGTADVETVYDSRIAQPSVLLLTGIGPNGAYTYDPTNGTISDGDVWRVKQ